MTTGYDVIVIGAGPAGYHAAIRAAQLGLKTACIDKSLGANGKPVLGGTCLNWGCIPSKALLDASHKYVEAREHLPVMGIKPGSVELDIAQMMAHKNAVVAKLTGGVAALYQGNGVAWLPGSGKLLAGRKVEYHPHEGSAQVIEAQNVILAPGSVAVMPSASVLPSPSTTQIAVVACDTSSPT